MVVVLLFPFSQYLTYMFNKIIRFITHIKTFANIIYFLFSVSNQIPSFLPKVIPVWPFLIAYEDYLFNYSNPAQGINDFNIVYGIDPNDNADTDADTEPDIPTFRTLNIQSPITSMRRNAIIPGNIVPPYNSGRFSGRIGSSRFERLFFASYYTRIDDHSASDNDNEENDDHNNNDNDNNNDNEHEHNIYNSHQYTLISSKKCTLCGLRRHNIRSCTHPAIDACVKEGKYLYIQEKLNTNEDTKNKMHTWRKTLSVPMMKAIFFRHSAIATFDPYVSTMTEWYNKYNPNDEEWDWALIDNCDIDFHNKYALPPNILITKSKSKKYLTAITHILFKYIVFSEENQPTDIQPPHALMPLHIINTPIFNKQLDSARTLNTAILTQSSMITAYDDLHCPICLEHTQKNNTVVTNCKHAFCIRCITLHIISRKTHHHLSCAMCREKVQTIHIQNCVPENYIENLQKAIIYGHNLNNIVSIQPI